MTATAPLADLTTLLRGLAPELHEGVYVFSCVPHDASLAFEAIATVREPEGTTLILEEHEAVRRGLPMLFRAAWITLTVHSDLAAVGLTAAIASALARAGISCNVVAGAHHDHLFVPFEERAAALRVLSALQREAERRPAPT